jgi:hypothetical protein
VLLDYPWGQYERFVDIAGAYGSFMASLLQRHPAAQGVLFDQAQVSTRELASKIFSALNVAHV